MRTEGRPGSAASRVVRPAGRPPASYEGTLAAITNAAPVSGDGPPDPRAKDPAPRQPSRPPDTARKSPGFVGKLTFFWTSQVDERTKVCQAPVTGDTGAALDSVLPRLDGVRGRA